MTESLSRGKRKLAAAARDTADTRSNSTRVLSTLEGISSDFDRKARTLESLMSTQDIRNLRLKPLNISIRHHHRSASRFVSPNYPHVRVRIIRHAIIIASKLEDPARGAGTSSGSIAESGQIDVNAGKTLRENREYCYGVPTTTDGAERGVRRGKTRVRHSQCAADSRSLRYR